MEKMKRRPLLFPAPASVPPSAVAPWICYVALLCYVPAVLAVSVFQPQIEWGIAVMAAVPALVMLALEVAFLKTPQRASTGMQLQHAWRPDWAAVGYKLLGFHTILACIALFYYMVPEYTNALYAFWFSFLRVVGPWAWCLVPLYFLAADGYQTDTARKEDLYHNLGRLLLRRGTAVPVSAARWHNLAREYGIKAFFLPLMVSFYKNNFLSVHNQGTHILQAMRAGSLTFHQIYSITVEVMYVADVAFASLGYVVSMKLFDAHVRSAEPALLGWMVAVACYPPFVTSLSSYTNWGSPQNAWDVYFRGAPRWFFWMWGTCIVLLTGIYCHATIVFGVRFSNLTNRGVITGGPYAYTRHPAYLSKNLSWWMITVPWSLHDGLGMAFKRCVRLTLVAVIYWTRAKTEEAHMLHDPAYVEYYNAIQLHYGLPTLSVSAAATDSPARSNAPAKCQLLHC